MVHSLCRGKELSKRAENSVHAISSNLNVEFDKNDDLEMISRNHWKINHNDDTFTFICSSLDLQRRENSAPMCKLDSLFFLVNMVSVSTITNALFDVTSQVLLPCIQRLLRLSPYSA